MKSLTAFLLLLLLSADSNLDYDLLIGSWQQKSFANTAHTGVFVFRKDSTATLQMRDGSTDALMGGMNGPYSLQRKQGFLTVDIAGRPKQFRILKLDDQQLTLHNEAEGKDPQIFERRTGED